MGRSALIVGGSGPTGPHIVDGLLERGYRVSVLHRGTHEMSYCGAVEHIHADPHFERTARAALEGRSFDVAIVTYGRLSVLAAILAGRCSQLIAVGAGAYRGWLELDGRVPLLIKEDGETATVPAQSAQPGAVFASKVRGAELAMFELCDRGAFAATYFCYPLVYGPRSVIPWEWSVVRRVADGRPFIVVADEGLHVRVRMASRNAAHAVLLAVGRADVANGQRYNIGDDQQYSLRDWLRLLIDAAGGGLGIVSLPNRIAKPAWALLPFGGVGTPHLLPDTSKIKLELDYSDVIDTQDALDESVAWYRTNPVTDRTHTDLHDRFDYELEDRLVAGYEAAMAKIAAEFDLRRSETHHHYPHPDSPNRLRDQRGR
jgi:nucleoside-diphosphate-sugar epimerase